MGQEDLFAEAVRLHRAGRLEEAERLFRQILAANPAHAQSLHLLGMICAQRGHLAEAQELIRRSLALEPDIAEAHYNLGAALQSLNRHEEAVAAYRRALELKPDVAGTHMQLSIALQELGEEAEAMAAAERALTIDPASAMAWYVMGELKTFAPDDPDIGRMERLLATAAERRISADDRLRLEFALGKAWMDAGEPDRAFPRLSAANRRRRGGYVYDVEADVRRLEAIAEALTPELAAALAGGGNPSDLPIFVVGMPRSGTTLIEQILASHPQVRGAGETLALKDAMGGGDLVDSCLRLMPKLSKPALARLGRGYVERLAALAPGVRRVVDKSPGNFRLAGLIWLMLPNARIIHCRRDPVDTCLSCYARYFSGALPYAFDLRELGLYYRAYDGLMTHWRALLPADRFIEIDYARVVGDLEAEARRLIDFCGLPWDDACLGFHATRRLVRTSSVNQVRRPIYRSSVGRWRAYERHLGPLIEALGEP